MTLTNEQTNHIVMTVRRQGVTLRTLSDDLIDHLCCDVEERMASGLTFQEAVHAALHDLSSQGLLHIQDQTEFLLQPNRIIMRKTIYFIGLAATISMTMGLLFKLLHMRGADELFSYGFFAFALLFLPALFVLRWKKQALSTFDKIKWICCFVSAVGTGCSVLAKVVYRSSYEPGATILIVSISLFCFGYLPLQFYSMYKDSLQQRRPDQELS